MLYLAEIQKQRGCLLGGGGKSELKLLASQRSDQNWSSVPDETIVADEASKFNDGALVLVDLSPNRQVQRIQEAGRPLVNILQNLSRQVERFKLKEEEIDQWKQSLNLQVQELNRREMEMESLWEQVQKLENDTKNVERQQQSIIHLAQKLNAYRQNLNVIVRSWKARGNTYELNSALCKRLCRKFKSLNL